MAAAPWTAWASPQVINPRSRHQAAPYRAACITSRPSLPAKETSDRREQALWRRRRRRRFFWGASWGALAGFLGGGQEPCERGGPRQRRPDAGGAIVEILTQH